MWALIHVYLLVGFDNRLRVTLQWVWAYITYERGARLIMSDIAVEARVTGRNQGDTRTSLFQQVSWPARPRSFGVAIT